MTPWWFEASETPREARFRGRRDPRFRRPSAGRELPLSHPRPVRPDVLLALLGDVTGSSRALRQLRALAGAGASIEVAMVGQARWPEALPRGTVLHALPAPAGRGPAYFWRAHRALAEHLAARPASVYHASDLHVLPAAAGAARRRGARLVYDAREWYRGVDAAAGRPWVGWGWGAIERRYAPRADLVLTVNDAIARLLVDRAGAERVTVMYNVSAPARGGSPAPSGALRRRLGIDDRAPLVLYQGLLRAGRGLFELLSAVAEVDGANAVLIGDGPLAEALRQRAGALGDRAFLLPFIPPDELATLTPDADLGAIPLVPLTESLRLSLPNKLFEYAAAGLPVLAGAGAEPLRDLVKRYDAGVVVDPTDHRGMVSAVRLALFDDDARARFRAGAARLHADHDWERERDRFLAAYGEVWQRAAAATN